MCVCRFKNFFFKIELLIARIPAIILSKRNCENGGLYIFSRYLLIVSKCLLFRLYIKDFVYKVIQNCNERNSTATRHLNLQYYSSRKRARNRYIYQALIGSWIGISYATQLLRRELPYLSDPSLRRAAKVK